MTTRHQDTPPRQSPSTDSEMERLLSRIAKSEAEARRCKAKLREVEMQKKKWRLAADQDWHDLYRLCCCRGDQGRSLFNRVSRERGGYAQVDTVLCNIRVALIHRLLCEVVLLPFGSGELKEALSRTALSTLRCVIPVVTRGLGDDDWIAWSWGELAQQAQANRDLCTGLVAIFSDALARAKQRGKAIPSRTDVKHACGIGCLGASALHRDAAGAEVGAPSSPPSLTPRVPVTPVCSAEKGPLLETEMAASPPAAQFLSSSMEDEDDDVREQEHEDERTDLLARCERPANETAAASPQGRKRRGRQSAGSAPAPKKPKIDFSKVRWLDRNANGSQADGHGSGDDGDAGDGDGDGHVGSQGHEPTADSAGSCAASDAGQAHEGEEGGEARRLDAWPSAAINGSEREIDGLLRGLKAAQARYRAAGPSAHGPGPMLVGAASEDTKQLLDQIRLCIATSVQHITAPDDDAETGSNDARWEEEPRLSKAGRLLQAAVAALTLLRDPRLILGALTVVPPDVVRRFEGLVASGERTREEEEG